MKAAGIDFKERWRGFRDIPEPSMPGPDEVLFEVVRVGVCGTDRELAAFHMGAPPPGRTFLALGHEALGRVIAAGPKSGYAPGDWVVPMLRRSCVPACVRCAAGRRDQCLTGQYTERGIIALDGYLTERALDGSEDLVRVPPAAAALAAWTEPLAVVEKAVRRALDMHDGGPAHRALVIGAGPLGLLSVLALRRRAFDVTAASLEAADSVQARLLKSAGADYCAPGDPLPERVDIAIEATGAPEAGFQAISRLGPMGVCAILGSRSGTGEMPFRAMVLANQAVFGSVNATRESFEAAVEQLPKLPGEVLLRATLTLPWTQFPATLGGSLQTSALKVVHQIVDC